MRGAVLPKCFVSSPELCAPDGVHFTEEGYKAIAETCIKNFGF